MEVGQVFNPYQTWWGSFIPNWLLRRKEVSHGAKLIYGRLAQYSGKTGICRPRQQLLADETGMCERQLREYLTELKNLRLIRSIQRGLGLSNEYLFVWHEWIKEAMQVTDVQYDSQGGEKLPSCTADSCRHERREVATPTVQEEIQLSVSEKRSKDEVPEEISFWNSHPKLPKVKAVTNSRLRSLKARKREPFFSANFRTAVAKILKSDFCLGMNQQRWRADFDWILQPDSVAKIIEGKYDNREPLKKKCDDQYILGGRPDNDPRRVLD